MSRKLQIRVSAAGGPEVAAALAGVKAAVQNRVLKAAARKQAAKAAKVAKARVRNRRTGQLGRSIGYVYRTYKRGTVWVYVVGPRRGFRTQVAALPRASQKRLVRLLGGAKRRRLTPLQLDRIVTRFVDPVLYAHLVEGGRKANVVKKKRVLSDGGTVFGRRVAAVAADPFMGPAAAAVSAAEMVADVRAGLEREARKAAARGKSIRG